MELTRTRLSYTIEQLELEIETLNARIKELESGSCRFNCRTKKEAFIAGWMCSVTHTTTDEREESVIATEAYKEWLDEKDN